MLSGPHFEVTPVTREIARHIIHPPVVWIPHLAGDVFTIATAALLPVQMRDRYELPWSARRAKARRAPSGAIRRTLPYLPRLVRNWTVGLREEPRPQQWSPSSWEESRCHAQVIRSPENVEDSGVRIVLLRRVRHVRRIGIGQVLNAEPDGDLVG